MNQNYDLGCDPVGRLLLRLSVPAIAAQVVNMLYNIVDRIYIARIPEVGSLALTGIGVTTPIVVLVTAFTSLIGIGGSARTSIAMGEGDGERAERVLGNCFSAILCIGVLLTAAILAGKGPLLTLLGASEATFGYADDYLTIYIAGTLCVMLTVGLNSFITCQGMSMTAMLTVLIGAVLNIVLDPIFIFVFGMGVQGAALATVLSQGVAAVWVLAFFFGKKTRLRIRRRNLRFSREVILPVLALGASPFVMQSTESLLSITYNVSLAKYGGDLAVGAMAVLVSLRQVMQLPLTGLTQGAQPILGYNFGARNPARMRQTVRYTVCAALVYVLLFWAAALFAPELLAGVFTPDRDLIAFTAWAIRIYFAVAVCSCFQHCYQQCFLALDEAKISLLLALLRKIVLLIPLILILPHFFENKLFAVFLSEPVADAIAAAVTTLAFQLRFRTILRGIETPDAQNG